jgi:hypothetical protein
MHFFQRPVEVRELIGAKDLNPGIMLPVERGDGAGCAGLNCIRWVIEP